MDGAKRVPGGPIVFVRSYVQALRIRPYFIPDGISNKSQREVESLRNHITHLTSHK